MTELGENSRIFWYSWAICTSLIALVMITDGMARRNKMEVEPCRVIEVAGEIVVSAAVGLVSR